MSDLSKLREVAEDAYVLTGPLPGRWDVEDDIKGDGLWDNEFNVLAENGEGSFVGSFPYRPLARHVATFDPPTVLALLDVAEAASNHTLPCLWPTSEGTLVEGNYRELSRQDCAGRCPACRMRIGLDRLREVAP